MTKNFKRHEIVCKCGCDRVIEDDVFMHRLQTLREMFGKPMAISSGFRCPDYNNRVSKTGFSGPHTIAAVDVITHGNDAYKLLWLAMSQGFDGIGLNQKGLFSKRFIHLDRLSLTNRPWVWTY